MSRILALTGLVVALSLLAGCATPPLHQDTDYSLQREAIKGSHAPVPEPLSVGASADQTLASGTAVETHYGTGVFVGSAPSAHGNGGTNAGGTITFNFDNQPVQAAVKAILGDVLHVNYSISPKVKGSVTFATSQPVTQAEMLPILQMLLSWTGNALVHQGDRYLVVPVAQAAPGNIVPGLGAVSPGSGYAARLFPLHFVSAAAMQDLLKPFATSSAFLLVDPARNLLVLGGTPAELANYQGIIRTFDVDWLRGMSVAVIPLQHVQADDLVSQLDSVFNGETGDKGKKVSSLVRLIPLKHSNSLVVITAQPRYIDEVRKLVTTIDNGAGNSSGLYVYNVLNMKASDLASHLNALFGNGGGNGGYAQPGAVAPGFSPLEQTSRGQLGGMGPSSGFGNFSPEGGSGADGSGGGGEFAAGAVSGATQSRRQRQSGQQSAVAFTTSGGVRIAAVNENNQLLIRAMPAEWQKLLPVIERLDEKPLQVQIETKVLEVTLTGDFQFGVQYYLGGLIGTMPGSPPNTDESYHRHQGAAGLGGVKYNPLTDALFYSFAGKDLQFAIKAMEGSGDVKVLSAPSTVVLNNQETTFKVGEKIPVVQTYYAPGTGIGSPNGNYNVGQVQYIDTGVLLDVVPRVNPGGLVYMDIQQVVSKPTTKDQYGNYTIANRALSTQVAVQSGQTVLLGGLIQQSDTNTRNGVPFLSRIPVLGRLFGTTEHSKSRTELIVLITPRVVRNPDDARRITDEYENKFQSLKPILPPAGSTPASAPVSVPPATSPAPEPMPAPVAPAPAPPASAPAHGASASTSMGGWSVLVAKFSGHAAAERLRERLQQLGYTSYLARVPAGNGTRWQVRAGPVVDRDVAARLRRAIADSLHISGMLLARG